MLTPVLKLIIFSGGTKQTVHPDQTSSADNKTDASGTPS